MNTTHSLPTRSSQSGTEERNCKQSVIEQCDSVVTAIGAAIISEPGKVAIG